MTRFLRYAILFLAVLFSTDMAFAQASEQIRGLHKVKRKETIFGIARQYDIKIDDLIEANPEMRQPDYELKKGDVIRIPYAKGTAPVAETPALADQRQAAASVDDVRQRAIRRSADGGILSGHPDGLRQSEEDWHLC